MRMFVVTSGAAQTGVWLTVAMKIIDDMQSICSKILFKLMQKIDQIPYLRTYRKQTNKNHNKLVLILMPAVYISVYSLHWFISLQNTIHNVKNNVDTTGSD